MKIREYNYFFLLAQFLVEMSQPDPGVPTNIQWLYLHSLRFLVKDMERLWRNIIDA